MVDIDDLISTLVVILIIPAVFPYLFIPVFLSLGWVTLSIIYGILSVILIIGYILEGVIQYIKDLTKD